MLDQQLLYVQCHAISLQRLQQFGEGLRHAHTNDANTDGFKQFNMKYGEQLPNGDYQVPAPWQSGLSNVSEKLGRGEKTGGEISI